MIYGNMADLWKNKIDPFLQFIVKESVIKEELENIYTDNVKLC